MEAFDWSVFTVRIGVHADTETLYRAWATRAGLESWFLRMAEFRKPDGAKRLSDALVKPGDLYTWRWHGWPDEVEELGRVLDTNETDYFRFSFGQAGNCAVTIREEAGLNVVELVQSDIPTDEKGMHYWHLGCKTGWTFYLTNLKSIFEGGLDLRNRDVGLKNVVNS